MVYFRRTAPASHGGLGSLRRRRLWVAGGLMCLLAAAGIGEWFSRQDIRPGMVHDRRGLADAAAGHAAQAQQEWLRGIRDDPRFPGCYVRMGDACTQTRQLPEAARFYGMAAELAPQDGDVFLKLAQTMQQAGDRSGAYAAAQRAAALAPNSAEALGLYGLLAADRGERQEAMTALRRAHQMRPDDGPILVRLAELEVDTADTAQAEQDLGPYLRAHPEDAEGSYVMALLQQRKPRTPQTLAAALFYAQCAYAKASGNTTVSSLLGSLYLAAGRPRDALRVFEDARARRANDVGTLRGLVTCDARLGRTAQAAQAQVALRAAFLRHDRIAHLNDVLQLTPADVRSGLERARLEEQEGDDRLAERHYEQQLRLSPHDPRTRAALAGFYRRLHRTDLSNRVLDPQFVP